MARVAADIIITKNIKRIKFSCITFNRVSNRYIGKTFSPAYYIKIRTDEGMCLYKSLCKTGNSILDVDYPINEKDIETLKNNAGEVKISLVSFN